MTSVGGCGYSRRDGPRWARANCVPSVGLAKIAPRALLPDLVHQPSLPDLCRDFDF